MFLALCPTASNTVTGPKYPKYVACNILAIFQERGEE